MKDFNKQVLIFKYNDQVSILFPCSDFRTLIEIGEKDIPNGIPFWIANEFQLPFNTPQETWDLDNMGTPDGYGKKE
jgi:hypothetical protein